MSIESPRCGYGPGPRARPMTGAAFFEMLATCRMNRYEPNELLECDYSITQATREQATILPAPWPRPDRSAGDRSTRARARDT